MKRREFIAIAGGVAAWPLAVRAQQSARLRRIGLLRVSTEDDARGKDHLAGLRDGLARFGWVEGSTIHCDYRYAGGHLDQFSVLAKELIALHPEVIFAQSTPVAAALQRETRTIPIVFVEVSDPIGSGFIAGLAHPGGNLTGIIQYEAGIAGKWLAMLKEIAPNLARVALLANPKGTAHEYFLGNATAAASALRIEIISSPVDNVADIERSISSLARQDNGGLLCPPETFITVHRDLVIALAAKYRLPAVYAWRYFVTDGGLMSYGIDLVDVYQQSASYIDQILRGANPADLPVQSPTKYETALNLKTAKALGFSVPTSLLVRADEVIEWRREFITLLGSMAAWPLTARAQQPSIRRIGVLSGSGSPEMLVAFRQAFRKLGWVEGLNCQLEVRSAGGDAALMKDFAKELVSMFPDVILVTTNQALSAVQQETTTIPVVFTMVGDPVGSGFVKSMARPEGNMTGFTSYEETMGGKWLEIIKEIAPAVSRVVLLFDPEAPSHRGYLRSAEPAATALRINLTTARAVTAEEIVQAIDAFALGDKGGVIILPQPATTNNRGIIISLAAQYHLPAVYPFSFFARDGGLLSYGIDPIDVYQKPASYVARILNGEKPADLPVQAPTKFETVINLKTAKALGLTIPQTLLATADEVIE